MGSLAISLIALVIIAVGAGAGFLLQSFLPAHLLSKDAQDTVKLGAGVIGMMAALVLGLLVSSAKSSFDSVRAGMAQNGARVILMDQVLEEYGPEARPVREQLRRSLAVAVREIWSDGTDGGPSGLRAAETTREPQSILAGLRTLAPTTDAQRDLLKQALQIGVEAQHRRLLMIEEQQSTMPPVFLVLLIAWLAVLFLTFGLFAPRNWLVAAALLVCAASIASAIFLILDMERPMDGYIRISDAPFVKALEILGTDVPDTAKP